MKNTTAVLRSKSLAVLLAVSLGLLSNGFSSANQPEAAYAGTCISPVTTFPVNGIIGSLTVGSVISASTSGVVPGASQDFQWLRDGLMIPGATNDTYLLTPDDYSHAISYNVTFSGPGMCTSNYGMPSYWSNWTLVQGAALSLTPAPTVSGESVAGSLLTSDPGQWDPGVTLSFAWRRDGFGITGAVESSYQLTSDDYGTQVSVQVTGSKPGYVSASRTSSPVFVAKGIFNSTPTPQILGPMTAGSLLTADPGVWDSGVSLTYDWLRDGTDFLSWHQSYLPSPDDWGHTIAVRVTGVKTGYTTASRTSPAVEIGLGSVPLNLTVAGSSSVDSVLTADSGFSGIGVVTSFQWLRDGSPIAGATDPSYYPGVADFGHPLSVRVTASGTGYLETSQTSEGTVVGAAYLTFTTNPTVTGDAVVGRPLTADPNADGWDAGVTFAYRWLRDDVPIGGATSARYVLTPADYGHDVSVEVTGSLEGYFDEVLSSDYFPVSIGSLVSTPKPAVVGTFKTGATLTANVGIWDSGTTFTYQWLRDGSPISGATNSTMSLTSEDFGHQLTLRVRGSLYGYRSNEQQSDSSLVGLGAISTSSVPIVSGLASPDSILSSDPGAWDSGVSISYQWLKNGQPIFGAVNSSYLVQQYDLGAWLGLSVVGSRLGYAPATATSVSFKVVPKTMLVSKPKVSGSIKVRSTIKALAGVWVVGAAIQYQWLLDGKAIKGATKSSYKLLPSQKGHKISCKIIESLTGYSSASSVSASAKIG